MKVIVNGANGRMGREVMKKVRETEDMDLVAAVDTVGADWFLYNFKQYAGPADVVIDFSNHAATADLLEYCRKQRAAAVIATTGQTPEELALIEEAAREIPIFRSGNLSIGVALLVRMVKQAAGIFGGCDVEIIEKHHNQKVDAPSGTALMLADAVKEARPDAVYTFGRQGQHKREPNEIGIHSLRMGNVVGEHEVIFATENQTISLRHEAHDRGIFAEGAVAAARFIVGQPAGLYTMEDLLG